MSYVRLDLKINTFLEEGNELSTRHEQQLHQHNNVKERQLLVNHHKIQLIKSEKFTEYSFVRIKCLSNL